MASEAKRKYDRDYHAKRSPDKKRHKQNLQRERIRSLRRKLTEYKSSMSCPCGEDNIACLDFHHVTKTKGKTVSNAVKEGWAWDRILDEVSKCVIICSNCHRKIHYKEVQ